MQKQILQKGEIERVKASEYTLNKIKEKSMNPDEIIIEQNGSAEIIIDEEAPVDTLDVSMSAEIKPEDAEQAIKELKRRRRTKAEMEAEKEEKAIQVARGLAQQVGNKDEVFGLEKEYEAVEYAIEQNMPVLLIGETGTGKTHLVRSIAHKQNKELIRLSLNGEIGINEIIGKWLVSNGSTYWQDGILTECARQGKWIVIDEINSALPEVLFAMHSLLDDDHALVLSEKDGEKVVAHPDFRLFAAMNPPDEYAGTREMNKALLSRFPVVLYINHYKPRTELQIVVYHSGIDDKAGKVLIDVASSIRRLKDERKIWYTCSTRDIINVAKLFVGNKHSLGDVLSWGIRNKASKEEWDEISNAIQNSSKIKLDTSWKHKDIEFLTEDLTKDIKELNRQKEELTKIVSDFEGQFKNIANRLNINHATAPAAPF